MEINYKKNNNNILFNSKNKDLLDIEEIQNYIPIFNNFFNLTSSNFKNFNLNYPYFLSDLIEKNSYNEYLASLISNDNLEDQPKEKKIFFKFCPLLDPIKVVSNKYDLSINLLNLPSLDISPQNFHPKILDNNNSAYVDGFFTFLTSKLLHYFNFFHGVDCYGTFLAIKNNFIYDISEDVDFLFNSEEFNANNNVLYNFTDSKYIEKLNFNSRNNKKKINIDSTDLSNDLVLSLSNITDLSNIDNILISNNISNIKEINDSSNCLIFESKLNNTSKHTGSDSSDCSSRSSNTDKSNTEDQNSSNNEDEEEESSSTCSSDEEQINISLNKFPIEIIALESCKNTLDSLISENKLNDNELDSIVLQILLILITYQKLFNMTHNDLHTNNIMYIETDKKYLYYKFNNTHYKVPTYGKIYKIIDFGRAIYTFKGKEMCSDSYHKEGDAGTQYNFGVYKDKNKPSVNPNYSFDLCRLGCSIFDFFIEDLDDLKKVKSNIKKIILNWCIDDRNKNILYKNNGEERYPDFKLYKMIARTVHNHIPAKEIENPYFSKYIISKKNIPKKSHIFNIDELTTYI